MRALLISVMLTLSLGCHGYKIHPGAPDKASSIAFDTLLVVDKVIVTAKAEYQAGNIPQSSVPLLNNLIDSYDTAKYALTIYSNAVSAKAPNLTDYSATLAGALTNMERALAEFKTGKTQ